MWIAACDDDIDFGEQIVSDLCEITSGDDQITFFGSGLELIETAYNSKLPIDMVLLDIEMPGLSGIESARELREISPETVIIIITRFMQYALKCYEIKAFNYLIKPVNIAQLKSTIDEIRNRKERENNSILHIETRENHVFIPFCDVLYVESYCRALYAHTRSNTYKFYQPIKRLNMELEENGFFRIHKSYIVNLSHIKRLDKSSQTVVLSTGEELPVGKRKIKDLVSSLINIRREGYYN